MKVMSIILFSQIVEPYEPRKFPTNAQINYEMQGVEPNVQSSSECFENGDSGEVSIQTSFQLLNYEFRTFTDVN